MTRTFATSGHNRGAVRLTALGFALSTACAGRGDPDNTAGNSDHGNGSEATSTAGESSPSESTGEQPDPVAISTACEAFCELADGCDPDFIPTYAESLEDCIASCIDGLELDYSDGCGPQQLMRITCWNGLTCEQWLEFIETGYSACGDTPEQMGPCPD